MRNPSINTCFGTSLPSSELIRFKLTVVAVVAALSDKAGSAIFSSVVYAYGSSGEKRTSSSKD